MGAQNELKRKTDLKTSTSAGGLEQRALAILMEGGSTCIHPGIVAEGRRYFFGFHSRLSFCALAIWAGVIVVSSASLAFFAISLPCAAARFRHM